VKQSLVNARKKRNEYKVVKSKKFQEMRASKKLEKECRKKRGGKEKVVFNSIEKMVLKKEHIHVSAYHGKDFEGPSLKLMMYGGVRIFNNIQKFLIDNKVNWSQTTTDEEIMEVCGGYGEVLQLLDGVFSLLNTPRREYNDDKQIKLEVSLELLRKKWIALNLSITPKVHMLLNHSAHLIKRLKGFVHMTEERIKKAPSKKGIGGC
jgi:hypothetical protein